MKSIKPLIYIIEDDPILAETMKDAFTQVGFKVKNANDGKQALDLFNKITPQVVILDILLPKKNGFEILEELKKNPNWKRIPVVIASNLSEETNISKGYSLGAGEYIVKSDLTLKDLVQKVTFLMNMSDHGRKFLDNH